MDQTGRDHLVRELSAIQKVVYGYVLTLTGRADAADDVLQEVNLAIWRKLDRNEPIRNLPALAYELARYEVMTWRQKCRRDKLQFSSDVLDLLATDAAPDAQIHHEAHNHLERCLEQLPPKSRQLIERRYLKPERVAVSELAAEMGCSTSSLSQRLYRIREALAECIRGSSRVPLREAAP